MIKKSKRVCSHYKPFSSLPHGCMDEKCSYCEYYSPKGCMKNYYDALEQTDEDVF